MQKPCKMQNEEPMDEEWQLGTPSRAPPSPTASCRYLKVDAALRQLELLGGSTTQATGGWGVFHSFFLTS